MAIFLGGQLATITSAEENAVVAEIAGNGGATAWIGLHDSNVEGVFEWIDGEEFVYVNWDTYRTWQGWVGTGYSETDWWGAGEEYDWRYWYTSGDTEYWEKQDRGGFLDATLFRWEQSRTLTPLEPYDYGGEDFVAINIDQAGEWRDIAGSTTTLDGFVMEEVGVSSTDYVRIEGDGTTYEFVQGNFTWTEARDYALLNGGHLVTIHSEAEARIVEDLTHGQVAWIGLHDENVEGFYEWVTGEAVTYTDWFDGEPNNYDNEDYVFTYLSGQWNDAQNTNGSPVGFV